METKVCIKCGKEKELTTDNFHYHKVSGQLRWVARCIQCEKERASQYFQDNKKKVYKRNRKSYHNRSEQTIEYDNYRHYRNYIQRTYGLTEQELRDMMDKQKGCCAICNISLPLGIISHRCFSVDHCHSTSQVRGLLCFKCNSGLGSYNDSVVLLNKAIQYLENK